MQYRRMQETAIPIDDLVRVYLQAKRLVVDGGYEYELAWQGRVGREPLTTSAFVQEAAWVVLCSGMSESVVRAKFPALTASLGGFDPAWIVRRRAAAQAAALKVFGHRRKIEAILEIASTAQTLGPVGLGKAMADPEPFLTGLPYVGPVTWRHLAKNLGVPVAKADRHLSRVAAAAGRSSVDRLCTEISQSLGEPVAVVDIVWWRWSVLHAARCAGPCAGLPHDAPAKPGKAREA